MGIRKINKIMGIILLSGVLTFSGCKSLKDRTNLGSEANKSYFLKNAVNKSNAAVKKETDASGEVQDEPQKKNTENTFKLISTMVYPQVNTNLPSYNIIKGSFANNTALVFELGGMEGFDEDFQELRIYKDGEPVPFMDEYVIPVGDGRVAAIAVIPNTRDSEYLDTLSYYIKLKERDMEEIELTSAGEVNKEMEDNGIVVDANENTYILRDGTVDGKSEMYVLMKEGTVSHENFTSVTLDSNDIYSSRGVYKVPFTLSSEEFTLNGYYFRVQ